MPRVIFFDAAGTLFHLPRGVGFHYAQVLARHGIGRDEETLDEAFRAVWSAMPVPEPTAGPRMDDDKGWWRDLVGRVLDRCGVSVHQVDRGPFFEELYAEFVRPAVWTLYPETLEVLERSPRASRWESSRISTAVFARLPRNSASITSFATSSFRVKSVPTNPTHESSIEPWNSQAPSRRTPCT
jgi:hypothetical protein